MEPQDLERQISGLRLSEAAPVYSAPETLLSGVLDRVEKLDPILARHVSESSLMEAVHDPHWDVRAAAIHALGKSGADVRMDLFTSALRDEHPAVRTAAVHALANLGERMPVEHLLFAVEDRDTEVREAVAEVLRARNRQPEVATRDRVTAAAGRRFRMAAQVSSTYSRSWRRSLLHFYLVLLRQPPVLQRNWLLPALMLLVSDALVVGMALQAHTGIHDTAITLALVTTVGAAVGMAFAANMGLDAGCELTLSTATPLRVILLSRFLVMVGATVVVSGGASVGMALLSGQGLWGIVQLWLGPVLLISSLTLALAMMIGSWLALLAAAALTAAQALRFGPDGMVLLQSHAPLWQTSPTMLVLAAACFAFALVCASRRPVFFEHATGGQ